MADFIDQHDSPRLAAILLGTAQAYRRIENYPPEADELPRLQLVIDRVRSSLGETAYAAAYAEGERLTIEQTLERVFAAAPTGSATPNISHSDDVGELSERATRGV
jgi:hypothetical protein